jgi:predicted ArsR family transcriptional regulator
MLGLLRTEGPATATTLANRLGLNSGATSYHLRQLEKHGFISEDEERGNARDRWWRAAHESTQTELTPTASPEEHDTYDGYLQAVAIVSHERLQRSLEERRSLPEEWQEAGDLSDWNIRLTPARAKEMVAAVHALVETYADRPDTSEDAVIFRINVNAFVTPGVVTRSYES